MLNKVKTEANNFVMIIEDLDLLDQVVGNLEKLFEFGFFKVSFCCIILYFGFLFCFGLSMYESAIY